MVHELSIALRVFLKGKKFTNIYGRGLLSDNANVTSEKNDLTTLTIHKWNDKILLVSILCFEVDTWKLKRLLAQKT